MRVGVCTLLAATMALAACTTPAPTGTQSREPSPSATQTTQPGPTATAGGAPEPARQYRMPLVLAVHHSRPAVDVSAELATRLVAGDAVAWSELGLDGDQVRHLSGSAPEVLEQVIADHDTLAVLSADHVDERVRVLTVEGVHPLRDPQDYLLWEATDAEPPPVVRVTVVGDIMLGRRVGDRYQGNLGRVFEPFAELLAAADVTVGNLESSLSDAGEPIQGGDSFAADPAAVDALVAAGFDAVTLANNHVGDFGRQAMLETFSLVDAGGLGRFGAGVDLAEASRPWVVEVDGVKIAFIGTESIGEAPGATPTEPGTNRLNMPPRTPPLDEEALERITAEIAHTVETHDVTIVMPHWGTQYTYEPEEIQRQIAQRWADVGVDLILGGHPHWVQGWDALGDTTVVYSLPNFVFDMEFSRQVQEGVLVEIVLWGEKVVAVEPVPYVIRDHIPQPADEATAARILSEMRISGRGPYAQPGD